MIKSWFQCMSVHAVTVTPLEESEKQSCPHDDYRTDEGTCCDKCSPGFKLEEKCHFNGHRSKCVPCPPGQYNSEKNYSPKCRTCRRCKASNFEVEETPCARHQNTICRCVDGFYKYMIDSETYECRRCSQCGSDETERQKCTPNQNTVCDCKEKYYRVNNQCEPFSELIYIVLDLVPVAMVKRLVRSLGVTDTEIEQAELDYRPCREAHYQMLRLWAKGGLRPGSRGEMLHGQLFEELVDKLRKIHLEWAAVELETKYGVQ
uniref:Tumor necrosis factor receptor superfamily member 6 n=1 Tax=Gouania willdenowi TaxID=441366 RepID=A0A8C5I2P3_GOUWI